jgi:DNA-3-methyladenine glycosylase
VPDTDCSLPPLAPAFYARPTLDLARALLGKTLVRRTAEGVTAGVIVETEAYVAAIDPAAHAYRGQTPRNRAMFGPPGHAYVYGIYGMHVCLNVVTEPAGEAAAVLVRAVEPTRGLELMRTRRGAAVPDRDLCRGPGRLCQAFAITLALGGASLQGPDLWVAETPGGVETPAVATSPRIGISRAADWPWRFYVPGSRYVSARPWR